MNQVERVITERVYKYSYEEIRNYKHLSVQSSHYKTKKG